MLKRWNTSVVAVATLTVAAAIAGAASAPPTEASASLQRKIPQVKFDAVSLSDAIDFVRDIGNLNLRVDWKTLEASGIDRTTPVTFYLRNITVEKALNTILREAGGGAKLALDVSEGIIEITTQEEADKNVVTEVYDVRDLQFAPLDAGDPPQVEFQLEAVTRGGGGGGGGTLFGGTSGQGNTQQSKTPEQKGEELVQLIISLVRPEVWNVNGGAASIRYFNGNLIVSAPRSVQDLIGTPVR